MTLATSPLAAQGLFVRGDCNQSVTVDITDPIFLLSFLFTGGPEPRCFDACDADDTEDLDITDAINVLRFLFLGDEAPDPPYPQEGLDPSGERLDCRNGVLPLDELRVEPDPLWLRSLGERAVLTVIGVTADGSLVDLRLDDKTLYSIADTSVAAVDPRGVVTARSVGRTTLLARHRGSEAEAEVVVLPGADGAPVPRILEPADGVLVVSPDVRLRGLVDIPDDSQGLALAVRVGEGPEQELAQVGGVFDTRVAVPLGVSTIRVAARVGDREGSDEVTVRRVVVTGDDAVGPDGKALVAAPPPRVEPPDSTPPALAIDAPVSGSRLLSALVDVEGSVDDDLATVRVNGVAAVVESGRFRAERVRLPSGRSEIVAEATDRVGNLASERVEVLVDDDDPTLRVLEPAGDSVRVVTTTVFDIAGEVTGPVARVLVDGAPAILGAGRFRARSTRGPGVHEIPVVAILGGEASRSLQTVVTVLVDTRGPALEILHPSPAALAAGSAFVAGPSMRVVGRVRDVDAPSEIDAGATVSLGSRTTRALGGFVLEVSVAAGGIDSELIARDARGQETRTPVRIARREGADRVRVVDGDGQSVVVGSAAPLPLRVELVDASGAPQPGARVTFRWLLGSGRFDDGSRVVELSTDAAGRASIGITAGAEAGPSTQVVVVEGPAPFWEPAVLVLSTTPRSARRLVASSGRERFGASGSTTVALGARVLDTAGNPLEGVGVRFSVLSGEATLEGGASVSTVSTDATGLARVVPRLPSGDSGSLVRAELGGTSPITFVLRGELPGPLADTALVGAVLDDRGVAAAAVGVHIVGRPELSTMTDSSGAFRFDGAPAGVVVVAVDAGPETTDARTRVELVAGRTRRLETPLRVAWTGDPWRSRALRVSESAGAVLTLRSLPGLRLEVAAGSVTFGDGRRDGLLRVTKPNLRALTSAVPDDGAPPIPLWISPADVRFDPPPRLVLPDADARPGVLAPLLTAALGEGAWRDVGLAVTREAGAVAESLSAQGPTGGGVWLVPRRPPAAPGAGVVVGSTRSLLPWTAQSPQRDESLILGDGVYAHSGELVIETVDLELRGRGLQYRLVRRYESRHAFRGSLGEGWEHEYADRRLLPVPGSRNLVRADGRGRFDEYLHDRSSGAWISPVGVFARLTSEPDGSLVERLVDGTRYHYRALDGSPAAGRLVSIEDRFANALRMVHDERGRLVEVLDPLRRRFVYDWTEDDLLRSVVGPAGRSVRYEHDVAGRLVAAISPAVAAPAGGQSFPEGLRTEYVYADLVGDARLDHNLVAVVSPSEVRAGTRRPRWRVSYGEDAATVAFDRVVRQERGPDGESGVVTFDYEDLGAARFDDLGDVDQWRAFLTTDVVVTRCVDGAGVTTEVTSCGAGLPTRIRVLTRDDGRPRAERSLHPPPGVTPPWYETRRTWDAEGRLVEEIHPSGRVTRLSYDLDAPLRWGRALPTRVERSAAPGIGGGNEALEIVRDPLFGEVVLERPAHVPAEEAERLATRRYLDYQEAPSVEPLATAAGVDPRDLRDALAHAGVVLGMGDLNGDGTVASRRGAIVREELPRDSDLDDPPTRVFRHDPYGREIERVDATGRLTRREHHPETDPDGDGEPRAEEGLDPAGGGWLAAEVIDPEGHAGRAPLSLRTEWTWDERGHVERVVDADGHVVESTHDALGRLIERRWPAPLGYRRQWHYDADGQLALERVENLRANEAGRHLLVSENRWIDTRREHDVYGRLTAITRELSEGEAGPAGSITDHFVHDGEGRVVRQQRPVEGTDESHELDERGLVIARTVGEGTPSASRVEVWRDAEGQPVLEVSADDADGDGERETRSWRYDGHGRLVAEVDALGGARVLERDALGRIVCEARTAPGAEGGALLARTTWTLDAQGRVIEERRALFGHDASPTQLVTRTERDAEGRVTALESADGSRVDLVLDGAGRVVEERWSSGAVVRLDLDGAGRVVRRVREDRSAEVIDAAAAGDPDYDEMGRLLERSVEVLVRDPLGRITARIDETGRTRRQRWSSLDQVVFRSDANAAPIGAAADPTLAGVLSLLDARQRARVNGHGNRERRLVDGLGRVVEVIRELRRDGTGDTPIETTNGFNTDGLVTERFEWDGNGHLVEWSDDRGNRTRVDWDAVGVPVAKTWPDGSVESWIVDRDGRPRAHTARDGTVTTQRFDALGRVVERVATPAEGSRAESVRQRFARDAAGRVSLAIDESADGSRRVVARRYDSLGRVVEEVADGLSVRFVHDAAGRLVERRDPDGRRLRIERDLEGGVCRVVTGAGLALARSSRTSSGRLLDRELLGGIAVGFLEDDAGGTLRLTGYDETGAVARLIWRRFDGSIAQGFEYGRDRVGRALWERELHRSGRGSAWRRDSLGREILFLPDLFDPRFPPVDPDQRLAVEHDGNHNWRSVERDRSILFYEVNALDQLVIAGVDVVRHDERGDTVLVGDLGAVFDAAGRCVRVERAGATVATYRWDAVAADDPWRWRGRGRRVLADVVRPAREQTAGVRRSVWALDALAEIRDGEGALVARYAYDESGAPIAVAEAVADADPVWRSLLSRADGSITAIADRTGRVVAVARYASRGAFRIYTGTGVPLSAPPVPNVLWHRGRVHDLESGLYVLGGRPFLPTIGRFLTPDRRVLPAGPLTLNAYAERPPAGGDPEEVEP